MHAAARAAGTALFACACLALVLPTRGAQQYVPAMPPLIRMCIQPYPPFTLTRDWEGKLIEELIKPADFNEPSSLTGMNYIGDNSSLIDGFDVAFAKLVFQDYLHSTVQFLPYPDTSSMYVGLRNGDCDAAMSAVELSSSRASCTPDCQDTSVTPLPVYSSEDYGLPSYDSRMDDICCLEYSIPYLPKSGFALFSVATRGKSNLLDAILSFQVLNAATPVLVAIVGFGWVMYFVERRLNGDQFETPSAGVYFAFVAMGTFGFGDLAPKTRTGRLLTIFWTIASVLSLSAFTSVVSSQLTLSQLAFAPITSFNQLMPSDFCVESDYQLARDLVSGAYSIPDDQLEANGVMLGTISSCSQAVIAGTKKVFASDKPVLNWLANKYFGTGNLYVSDTLRGNPLSVAFRSGSTLRPRVDIAIIDMLTNMSWVDSTGSLIDLWFPRGAANAPFDEQVLDVPMFTAAIVLLSVTLLIAGAQLALEQRLVARAAKNALNTISTELHINMGSPRMPKLKTEAARVEAAATAAAGARDAARAAAAAAAAAEALAAEVEELAAALDSAEQEGPEGTPRSSKIAMLAM